MRIVAQIGLTNSADIPQVPQALDLVKDPEGHKVFEILLARQENGRSFALPPGTPPDILEAFRKGFAAMVKDPAFLADAAKLNADIVVATGDEIEGLLVKTYGSPRAADRSRQRGIQEGRDRPLSAGPVRGFRAPPTSATMAP